MPLTTLLMLLGIALVNAGALIAQWMRVKTDIATINVKIMDLENKMNKHEEANNKLFDSINNKLEKIADNNSKEHTDIVKAINALKIEVVENKYKHD